MIFLWTSYWRDRIVQPIVTGEKKECPSDIHMCVSTGSHVNAVEVFCAGFFGHFLDERFSEIFWRSNLARFILE